MNENAYRTPKEARKNSYPPQSLPESFQGRLQVSSVLSSPAAS